MARPATGVVVLTAEPRILHFAFMRLGPDRRQDGGRAEARTTVRSVLQLLAAPPTRHLSESWDLHEAGVTYPNRDIPAFAGMTGRGGGLRVTGRENGPRKRAGGMRRESRPKRAGPRGPAERTSSRDGCAAEKRAQRRRRLLPAIPHPSNRHPMRVPARNGTTAVSPVPIDAGTSTASRTSVTVPSLSGSP